MAEWRYFQLILTGKNHVYQRYTRYAYAVRQTVGNAFSRNLET